MLVGGIEAGGTKFVCGIGNENNELIERVSFPTTTPEETLAQVFAFFDQHPIEKMGVASFGPIDVVPDSPTYGHVLSTPKLAWKDFDFLGALKERYNIPIGWTTDVNGAALGETELGAAKGLKHTLYITIGTGIGAGAIVDGEILQGMGHPEMGHIPVRQHPDDHFEGLCPYHGACLEGLAAGPTVKARLGKEGKDVSPDDAVWDYLASYISQALLSYTLILRPERIVLGGGVMKVPGLLDKVKHQFEREVGGYVTYPDVEEYLVLPGLGDDAGIVGTLILANRQ